MKKILYCGNTQICEVHMADTFLKRFAGYMFREKPHHQALLFKPCNSIHTFFMKFHIDVLFVNEEMEIIKKIENFPPKRMAAPIKGSKIVIESKAGNLNKCVVGSKISFKKN